MEPQPINDVARKAQAKPAVAPMLLLSLAGAALITGAAVVGVHLGGGASRSGAAGPDRVSRSNQQARTQAFAAMTPLGLSLVQDRDVPAAIEGMQLPPSQKQALQAQMTAPSPALAPPSAPAPKPAPAVHPAIMPLRLAWLTLWDTDVQDGDVVRIESQGYARTVTLTKAPVTFAVPVPAEGVVKVIGVSDGDGGGITVGLASGGAEAVFPLMSDGQTLGLRVAVP